MAAPPSSSPLSSLLPSLPSPSPLPLSPSQAARVTYECNKLKESGPFIRTRPFQYSNTPQLDLDSFVTFTQAVKLRVRGVVYDVVFNIQPSLLPPSLSPSSLSLLPSLSSPPVPLSPSPLPLPPLPSPSGHHVRYPNPPMDGVHDSGGLHLHDVDPLPNWYLLLLKVPLTISLVNSHLYHVDLVTFVIMSNCILYGNDV